MKSVVIIGASHAAVEAISTLRKKGWNGKIILVGEEKLPIFRINKTRGKSGPIKPYIFERI